MVEDIRTDQFDHLFTAAVQDTLGEEGYGAWRSIEAPDAVSLSFGFPYPDSFPNEELQAATEAVLDVEADTALQYGGGEYAEYLAEFVAEREREQGVDCTAEQVMLTNGSTHAIDVVCQAFLDRGDSLFVESPTFMGSLHLFKNYSVDVTGFPVDSEGLDVDAVAEELADRRARGADMPKLFYVIPTFQNPTGTTLSLERRKRLLDLAAEYDFLLVEDDPYVDLRYYGEEIPSLKSLDETGRVVRINTFSKTIAPGVRTGWVVADDEVMEQLRRLNAGGTNTFTQSVLGRYCDEGLFEENVAEFRRSYRERRDHMVDCLREYMPAEAEWTEPDGGFFIWVELPEGIDAEEMLPQAAEEGVVYLSGSRFFVDDDGENCLRLSFSFVSLDEMERGIEALARATRSVMAES